MKRLLIVSLSLFIFCITSSLAIGEEVVASLPDADNIKQADSVKQVNTKKNVSNESQELASSFIEQYKEKNWLVADPSKCNPKCSGEKPICCSDINGTWCAANEMCKK